MVSLSSHSCCHERGRAPDARRYCRDGRNLCRGKERCGKGWNTADNNKEIVIGLRQRGGELRFFHAGDVKSGTLAKYITENVSADVDVMVTDEMPAYPKAMIGAGVHGSKHKTIRHKSKIYVDGDIHTNTVESAFSLLKRG